MNPVLSLLYSQDCRTFVCYLKPTLTDLGALLEECVDDLTFPLKPSKTQNLSRCRACVVVITRGFLTFLETSRDFAYKIACCLQPSKTVALLVGVTEWDICCYHKTILASYYGWTRFIATNNIIPSQAVCCIRDLITGPGENTVKIQEKETTIKNMESLQALEETKDIQQKVGTMENSYEETNEWYPTAQRDKTDDILGEKIKESSNVSEKEEDIQEKTIPKSTESSETPKKTTNIEEQNSAEKHSELPKLLKRKNVIKKKKLVEKEKEKDGAEGSPEPFEPRKIKDDNQEKPINNKPETLKQMNVWENTAKENSESEKIGDVQEHLKLENNVEPEIKRSTSKNTERLKSRPTLKKTSMIGKHTNSFQLLDGEPVKTTETLELPNEGEGSKKGEKEGVETRRSSFTNYVQEQDDVHGAKRSVMSIRKSSKTKDTRTPNESELSETSEDTRRKRHLRYTESSQSLTGTDAKKKNTANGTGLALNDMESSDTFRKSDDARGKEVRRSVETFWLFEQMDSAREKTANQDPEKILLDEKTENIQEISTEIVMVPQRVDKDNDCVFIIFTSLLNDIQNIYILLERNIIKEIPIHLLNPYVVVFFVPEQFLNVQGTVNVHIRYDNQLLDVKCLNVGSASQTPCCRCLVSEATSPLDLTPVADFSMFEDDVTVIQTDNEEDNPCDGSDFSKTDENELDDNTVRSFLKFFALYGFGEQDDFALEILNEGNDQEQKSFEVLLSDCQVSENVTLRDATSHKKETLLRSSLVLPSVKETSDLRRSASLPSLPTATAAQEDNENEELVEMEEYNESEGSIETGYMEMSPRYTGKKPHEIALAELLNGDTDSNQLNSISSNIYVSMKPNLEDANNNDAAVNNLCESQKELLELLKAFKTGGMTFQDVETGFKEWISKHGDSVDYRDVTFRQHDDEDTVQKERKRQSFGFADIVRLISGKPKKKTKIKAQPQEAKAQQKTDKVRDRHLKTLSKISNSSASSAWSLSSDSCQIPPTNGNQERKRDSGNHSDSNEDSKNKMLTEDEKSTKWFIIPPSIPTVPYCPASGEGTPPSLPSRPPPSVQIINERRLNLPNRLPPKPREMPEAPPALPPKRAIIQKAAVSLDQVQSNQKKKKSKDTTTKAKKTPRDTSPDYITVTNHPLSPPNTRDQFKQATQPNLSQIRRNNYAMERLKLSTDPPRKSSAPEMGARSNSPRNITNTPTISRVAISPLIFSQKEHHMRYNKPLIPGSRRSASCPNLLKPKEKEEKVHTYIELQGDSNHSQNKSYLHSNKGQESKLADPPPLPPRS